MTLLDKEPVKRVDRLLRGFDSTQKVIVLDNSARTALEAASSLGCEVGAIVKSLLFKTEGTFILCLVAGDKKASLNKIKKILEIQKYLPEIQSKTNPYDVCEKRIIEIISTTI